MQLQINNFRIFVQAMSLIFDLKQVYIQWNLMIQDETGMWIVPPDSNCTVGMMIEGQTAYDAFLALDRNGQDTQLVAYLQTLYPVTP